VDAEEKRFADELPGIISSRLAERQKAIIDSRADEMLEWFCDASIDDTLASYPVEEVVVDLGRQPCVGVASEGDPPISITRYSMENMDISRSVALQVCDGDSAATRARDARDGHRAASASCLSVLRRCP
jgi:hypothetical protein